MPLDQFHHAFIRLVAGEFRQQQALDEAQIDLNEDSFAAFRKPMAAGNQTFEPAKEYFNLPALPVEARAV